MYELIDRIVTLDMGNRGIGGLYAPARAHVGEPVSLAAARRLQDLQPGDVVCILTGSLSRASVTWTIGENDGPVGAVALARALNYGFRAIPVLMTDPTMVAKVSALAERAGLNAMSLEEARRGAVARRFTGLAVTMTSEREDAAARKRAVEIVDELAPKAIVAVERAGMTADGTYRDMLGQDYTEGRARLDYVLHEAARRGAPTIGIGDGGNEIGMGLVREAVHEHIRYGEVLCCAVATDVLLPVGVSNWGCYAVQAALACLTGNRDLLHTAALERRLLEASPACGLIDGTSGKLEPTADGLPMDVHLSIASLLHEAGLRGIAERAAC